MKLALRIEFADKKRMPEEPMGDFFDFDTIEDFIYFNRQEIDEVKTFSEGTGFEEFWDKVDEKLLAQDFYIEPFTEDSSYVVIQDM